MTDFSRNPFFQNEHIQSIGNNLIKAFNDDGSGAERQARRRLLDAQTEDQVGKNRGREAAATAVQGLDPSQPITAQFLQNVYSNYVRSGMDPSRASAIVLGMTANGGAPDPVVARAFVGSGHAIGKDQGFSIGDREGIAKRENSAALNRTATSAGIAAGASRANNADSLRQNQEQFNISQQFREKTRFDAPHNVSEGGAVFFKPEDPRFPGRTSGDVPVPKPPAADRFVQTPGADGKPVYQPVAPGLPAMPPRAIADQFVITPTPDGPVYQLVAPGLPAMPPKDVRPPLATPNAMADMQFNVLKGIPGAWDEAAKAPNADFLKQFGPALEPAMVEAAEVYQRTGSAPAAELVLRQKLGIKPGMSFETGGIFSSPGIRNSDGSKPKAAPPAGTAQAAPSISEQFAPKPGQGPAAGPAATAAPPPPPADPAQRKPGVYSTPKGPMTWTGTGWVKTQNANDGAR